MNPDVVRLAKAVVYLFSVLEELTEQELEALDPRIERLADGSLT